MDTHYTVTTTEVWTDSKATVTLSEEAIYYVSNNHNTIAKISCVSNLPDRPHNIMNS